MKRVLLRITATLLLGLFWVTSGEAAEWVEPHTGMVFLWVPGGRFEMGCGPWTDSCGEDEQPLHTRQVDGFWLGKYEVTQGQWQAVLGENPSRFPFGDDYPVEKVSWNDAQRFIAQLNQLGQDHFRLPTEAEWEYACRSGGKPERFAGGQEVDALGWNGLNSNHRSHPVGRKRANGLGLHDMVGNVWEWVQDAYSKEGYRAARQEPNDEPADPARVNRGGSWYFYPNVLRCANRNSAAPDVRIYDQGMRLARSP